MRLARFDNWSTGVVLDDDRLLDLTATVHQPTLVPSPAVERIRPFFTAGSVDWAPLISNWRSIAPALGEIVERASAPSPDPSLVVRSLGDVALLPPLPSPHTRIFALAANFADHLARAYSVIKGVPVSEEAVTADARRNHPTGFFVVPDTVIGHDGVVTPPAGHRLLDYEVEAAVVLARQDDGRCTAWGYTAWNDLSVRDKYFPGGPPIDMGLLVWALQKNFISGNAAGPWLVVEDGIDATDLSLQTWVNGEQRQKGSTAEMIYSFDETIEHLSSYLPLRSGDILVSGTPAGTALEEGLDGPYLKPGDVVEIQVGSGGGVLRNVVGPF